jgi:hypothetical protein
VQRSQFDELQTAWRHQCAADIKGNSSAFKLSMINFFNHLVFISFLSVTTADTDSSFVPTGECRICVPSLNMCFSTNKLQSLNIVGNIFDVSKSARPLTIQDYICILIENDKYLDGELVNMINNLPLLTSHRRFSNRLLSSTNDVDNSGKINRLI